MGASQKAKINLYGQFRVLSEGGDDITPKGNKTQGLLALLADAPDCERTRRWLEDMLWSDRSSSQASSSLRQALFEARKAFAELSDAIVATRQSIRLNPDRVEVQKPPSPDATFLDGMNIKDNAFEHWLLQRRGVFGPTAYRGTTDDAVYIKCLAEPHGQLGNIEATLADMTRKTLTEFFGIEVIRFEESIAPTTLLVTIQAFQLPANRGLRVLIERPDVAQPLWAETYYGDIDPMDRGLPALAHRVTDQVVELATSVHGLPVSNSKYFTGLAFRKMFSMQYDEIQEAGTLLDLAAEEKERGVLHAWRGQLAAIKFVERLESNVEPLWELAEESCAKAMELDPLNSYALAAVANTRLILGHEITASLELARLGVRRNPSNAYAWWVWSNAKLYSGDTQSAYSAAIAAQRIGDNSRLKFWCDFQRSLTAAMVGNTEEAIRFGEASAALAPNFRPPLRYLAALYAKSGKIKDVERNFERLKRIEPDFTIERYLEDPNYPISMIRRSGLLKQRGFDEISR